MVGRHLRAILASLRGPRRGGGVPPVHRGRRWPVQAGTSDSGDGADDVATFLRVPFSPPTDAMFTLSSLICGGVLEHHPGLRIGFVECSGGWAVPLLDRLDQRFEHLGQTMGAYLKMPPSEYFKRQCWISFDPDEPSLAFSAAQFGADRIMVGSDFPHPDAFYPDFVGMVQKEIDGLDESDHRKILSESARAFYNLPPLPTA